MLSIRNLCGVCRTLPGTGGVRLTPVAREDLGARIRLEPAGERLGLSIGQEFYKPVPFEVHERGAVASALTMRAQSSTPRTRAGSGGPAVASVGSGRSSSLGWDSPQCASPGVIRLPHRVRRREHVAAW